MARHSVGPEKLIALEQAGEAARRAGEALAERDRAIAEASRAGASLREISAATAIPHVTVQRIIERAD